MYRAWICGLLLVAASGVVAVPPAQATVMMNMSTKELTERASLVVRGIVDRQQVVEVKGHLWTDSYVRVEETIKGSAKTGQVVVMRQPGGETVVVGERVAGAATFSIGEEVLVFARPVRDFYVPVGMCLGKYRLVRGSDGAVRAERDFSGATLASFDPRGRFSLHDPGPSHKDQRLLFDLRRAVQQAMKGGVR